MRCYAVGQSKVLYKMVKTYPIPCTKEEMSKLLEAASTDDYYYTLFVVAKTTGRRLGELYNVRVKDFDSENNILVTQVLKRRRRIEKEAVLTPEASRLLKIYIIKNKFKLEDYIFRKVSYRQIQYKVKSYAKEAGINHNVSFHNFRHYLITELVRKGWSYDKIAKLTGHSSVGTLASYDHATSLDIKDDALEALKDL